MSDIVVFYYSLFILSLHLLKLPFKTFLCLWAHLKFTTLYEACNGFFCGFRIFTILLPGIWDTMFNIIAYFQGYRIFRKTNYGDICQLTMGYLPVYFKGYGILVTPYICL